VVYTPSTFCVSNVLVTDRVEVGAGVAICVGIETGVMLGAGVEAKDVGENAEDRPHPDIIKLITRTSAEIFFRHAFIGFPMKSDRKSSHQLFVSLDSANPPHFLRRSRCSVEYSLRFFLQYIDGSSLILQ